MAVGSGIGGWVLEREGQVIVGGCSLLCWQGVGVVEWFMVEKMRLFSNGLWWSGFPFG